MSPAPSGKLSKEEVDALLRATRTDEQTPDRAEPPRRVQGYDFQQPSRFNKAQLDRLRRINEALAAQVAAHASRLLRSNVKVQLVSMDHMKWENLLDESGESVVGFVFVLEPVGRRGLVTIDGHFAATALERMMGGQVDSGQEATLEFTDLDVRVLSGLLAAFLDPLPEFWSSSGEFQVRLGQFVRELQTLDIFPGSEDFVVFSFLLQSNVGSGQVALVAPFEAVRSLPPEADEDERRSLVSDDSHEQALRENLKRASVELAVVLGCADVKVGRLIRLEPGDLVVLDRRVGEALDIRVNDKVKLKGYPGLHGGKLAVRLSIEE